MAQNNTTGATPQNPAEDAVDLDIESESDVIDFIKHHVNVASSVEVVRNAPGGGFKGTASGFAGGGVFVASTTKTGPSKAQAKASAEAAIKGGAIKVTLAKQPDGTWTVA